MLPVVAEQQAGASPPPSANATPAIGAAVSVELPNKKKLVAQVDGGNGHSGVRAPELHFGLGDVPDDAMLNVNIQWRDRTGKLRQESHNLTPTWHTIVLGD